VTRSSWRDRALPLIVLVVVLGCDSPFAGKVCPDDLRVHRTPTDTVIRVGQSFTPTFQFLGCAGTEPLDDVLAFTSTAPDILQVVSQSGRATGLVPGDASIRVSGAKYGESGATIDVKVIP
jgi:hypothetical protein